MDCKSSSAQAAQVPLQKSNLGPLGIVPRRIQYQRELHKRIDWTERPRPRWKLVLKAFLHLGLCCVGWFCGGTSFLQDRQLLSCKHLKAIYSIQGLASFPTVIKSSFLSQMVSASVLLPPPPRIAQLSNYFKRSWLFVLLSTTGGIT